MKASRKPAPASRGVPASRLRLDHARIAECCRRWKITRLELFGSALRDDFRPDSDVDLLATFAPDAGTTLLDLARIQDELEAIIGRRVDLVSRRGIERSENTARRTEILETAQPVYAS